MKLHFMSSGFLAGIKCENFYSEYYYFLIFVPYPDPNTFDACMAFAII
jgi:hypothetical protein